MKDVTQLAKDVTEQVGSVIVGKDEQVGLLLVALLTEGHVVIDDVPGVAKTLLVKTLAAALGLKFARVQCTPDLLPGDVTGSQVFNQKTAGFEFRPGPVFANFVLADEINRATPRTQSSSARSDGGAAGHRRWRGPSVAAPVPRDGDAEPGGAQRHLSAAGGAARPVPDEAAPRLPDASRRGAHARAVPQRGTARRRARRRHRRGHPRRSRRRPPSARERRHRELHRRDRARHTGDAGAGARREPARGADADARRASARRFSLGATSSRPTTSSRSRRRCSRIG